jgi:hypothetical protein
LPDADFVVASADAVVAGLDGRIVFVGTPADAEAQVTRRRGAMRIDASGCAIVAAHGTLAVGEPLDLFITHDDTIRMEIAAGKIVRWEQR